MSDKTKNCPIPGCGAPPEEEGNMIRCSHKRCEFSEWVTRVLWQALPRSTEAEQDALEKHLCEIAERVGFTGNGESVLDAVDRRLSALEGAAAHGSVWIVGRGNHDEIKVYAGADKKAAGEDFDSRVSSPYSKYQIKCDVIGTPTPPVSSYPQTCGTCGRFTPPDGDCYGCEADRLTARLAALEAAVETVWVVIWDKPGWHDVEVYATEEEGYNRANAGENTGHVQIRRCTIQGTPPQPKIGPSELLQRAYDEVQYGDADLALGRILDWIIAHEQEHTIEVSKGVKMYDLSKSPVDCGDSSCICAYPLTGMRTNGGCRCGRRHPTEMENVRELRNALMWWRKKFEEKKDDTASS